MAKKKIAVVSYSLNPADPMTTDAVVFRDTLNQTGLYQASLVHQWALDETSNHFLSAAKWKEFSGIVICNFYYYWNLREVILSKLPVICANIGYVDDLGLGEMPQEHVSEHKFNVVQAHAITQGFPVGGLGIGNSVWLDSTSTLDHRVDGLVTTMANRPVLVAHKTHKLVYFGWYRMSDAQSGSPLFQLLSQAAQWAF
jgi:hypothetical protein